MYKIIRFYFGNGSRVIKRGLTLEQAQEEIKDLQALEILNHSNLNKKEETKLNQ